MRIQLSFPLKAINCWIRLFFFNPICFCFCLIVAHIINKHYLWDKPIPFPRKFLATNICFVIFLILFSLWKKWKVKEKTQWQDSCLNFVCLLGEGCTQQGRFFERNNRKTKPFLFLFYFIFFFATLLSTTIVWSVFQRKKKPTELPLARDVLSQEWSQVSLEKLKASLLFYIICVVTKAIVDEDHTQTIADCTKSREICPFLLLQKKKKNQNFFHCTTEKTSVANPCRFRILTSSSRLVLRKKNLP